jgi:hypothetical protein
VLQREQGALHETNRSGQQKQNNQAVEPKTTNSNPLVGHKPKDSAIEAISGIH